MPADNDIEINLDTGDILENQKDPDTNQEESQAHVDNEDNPSSTSTEDEPSSPNDSANDEELNNAETDAERAAIRERRRQERHNRKVAQREREDNLRRELASRDAQLNELRQQVDAINRRNTGNEIAKLREAKSQTERAYAFFRDQIQVATESKNGAAVAEATEKLIEARERLKQIEAYEKSMAKVQQAPAPLDPRLVNHAKEWMSRNPWYNAVDGDQDTAVAMAIDQALGRENWDPTTREYWDELDRRIKKYLPHRAQPGKMNPKPKSPVAGSSREAAPSGTQGSNTSGTGTFRLSPERVQALKDAGVWDDPKSRADAVRRYREFDLQQKQG